MDAAAENWKKYLPRYIAEVEAEPGEAPALVREIAAEHRAQHRAALDHAVSGVPLSDLERLKQQMLPHAKAPYWMSVTEGLTAITAEWHQRGLLPEAPRIVWEMLNEDFKADRARASDDLTNAPAQVRCWRAIADVQEQHRKIVNIDDGRFRLMRRGRSPLPRPSHR